MNENSFKVVGKNVKKIDALALACGMPSYTDDVKIPNMLEAKLLLSPYAHAIIKDIDTSEAEKVPGIKAILTYKNVPRKFYTTAGQGYPEPSPYDRAILDNRVRHYGDFVAVVAGTSIKAVNEALSKIKVDYEILEPLLDFEKALNKDAPIIHPEDEAYLPIPALYKPKKNLVAHINFEIGNVEKAFNESDYVIEKTFYTHFCSHSMMEPHITICYFDDKGRLVIRTSTQVPFHVRRIVAKTLDIPASKIRVIKPRIGGGFGGKQEIILEVITALLAIRTMRPVRLQLSRREVFLIGRTRHPQRITMKVGFNRNGKINALFMDVLMNTGAYGSHGLTVMSNTGSKVLPLFNKIENIKYDGKTVYTNLPIGGAYRGYGATQGYFAFGVMVDIIAEKLNKDIIQFYKENHIKEGETSPVFKILGEGRAGREMIIQSCALSKCIDIGAKEIDWYNKRGKRITDGEWVKGVGMACMMQGSSITDIDMASAFIKLNDDGSFNLNIGATDLGTGSDTVLAQIAAETLSVDIDKIIVYSSDTDLTPFDKGAYASSTTYLSGNAVKKAASKLKEKILLTASKWLGIDKEKLNLQDGFIIDEKGSKLKSLSQIALYSLYQKDQEQLMAEASVHSIKSPPPFAAHFAEVAVNKETGKVKVIKYVAVVDCGTPINPKLAEGQTEGAVLNGISWTLTERYIFNEKGALLNTSFGNYKIFNAYDLPEIKTILIPTYEPTGPYGAKSVSEISINGPAPAIANAIYDAIGIRFFKLPITPEKVFKALKEGRKEYYV